MGGYRENLLRDEETVKRDKVGERLSVGDKFDRARLESILV